MNEEFVNYYFRVIVNCVFIFFFFVFKFCNEKDKFFEKKRLKNWEYEFVYN